MAIDYQNIYSDLIEGGDMSMDRENPNVTSPYTGQLNLPTQEEILADVDPLQTGMDPSGIVQTGIGLQSQGKKILEGLGIQNPFANPYAVEGTSGFAQTNLGSKVMFKDAPLADATAFQNPETLQVFQPDMLYTEGGQAFDSIAAAEAAGVDPTTLTPGSEVAGTVPVAQTGTGSFLTDLTGGGGSAAAAKAGGITALVGTGIKMIADDDDPTTMNVGETVGTGLQAGGTGVAAAGLLGLGATAIPIVGLAAAAFGLLRGKKKRDEARRLEKEREIQQKTVDAYRESFDNYAARRQRFLREQSKEQRDAGLKNIYSA